MDRCRDRSRDGSGDRSGSENRSGGRSGAGRGIGRRIGGRIGAGWMGGSIGRAVRDRSGDRSGDRLGDGSGDRIGIGRGIGRELGRGVGQGIGRGIDRGLGRRVGQGISRGMGRGIGREIRWEWVQGSFAKNMRRTQWCPDSGRCDSRCCAFDEVRWVALCWAALGRLPLGWVGLGRIGSGWIGPGRFGLSGVCADVLDSSTLPCILSRPQHIPDGSLRLAPNSLHETRDWNETIGAGLQGQCRRPEKPPWEGPIASCPLPYTLVRTLQCPDGCIPDSGLYFIHVLSGVCGSKFVFLNASPIATRSLSCPYG